MAGGNGRRMSLTNHKCSKKNLAILLIFALFSVICHICRAQKSAKASTAAWRSAGQDLANTRFQAQEKTINVSNVKTLKVKWSFATGGDVSATPSVFNNVVYAPDWAGNLFAINAITGRQIWQHRISEYDGQQGSISRVSPLVLND